MKKLLTLFVLVAFGFTANAQTTTQEPQKPSKVKFKEVVYDFGNLEYGADGSHTFAFENLSKEPVTITNVGTSCGCTTPHWSKEPVMPKKEGSVTARYDTSRIGSFYKTLTVQFADETITLTIKGNVEKPKEESAN